MPIIYRYAFIVTFLFCYLVCTFAKSEEKINEEEIIIEADELIYNKNEESISAKGDVYIRQKDLHLIADKVIYDKKRQYLYAIGNLAFRNDNKNVLFGTKAFFDRNRSVGIIIRFKARLSQKGLLSSDFAQIIDKKTFLVQGLVFSTCKVCKENTVPYTPLWQFRAKEALINRKEEKIEYRHTRIELFGIPIFYFPYFSTPTPHASRKSGFLPPKLKKSNVLGMQIRIPYYFNISPQMDLIYAPNFSSKDNILNELRFRHLTKYGLYSAKGLFTYTTKTNPQGNNLTGKTLKGFFQSRGSFKFKNNYFLDYQLQRMLDNTKKFTEKYDINKDDVLLSKISIRKSEKNQLFMLDSLSFQDLRSPKKEDSRVSEGTSYVLPWIRTCNKLPFELPFNSEVILSSDLLNLRRKENPYKKGTLQLDLRNNIILPLGQMLSINPALRYDYYDISAEKSIKSKSQAFGKLFIDWKWPFIKQIKNNNVIVEPIANFTFNSLNRKSSLSKFYQPQNINKINIFSSDFFTNKDNLDLDSRVNYGVRTNYYVGNNTYGMVLTQSYRLNKQSNSETGENTSYLWDDKLKKQRTLMKGKLYIQFDDKISFLNNLDLMPNHLDLVKNEFDIDTSYKKFKFNLNHTFINKKYVNKSYGIYDQEIGIALQYNFYEHWWIKTRGKRKLGSFIKAIKAEPENKENKKWVSNEVELIYKGDCLNVNFGVRKDYSKPKDLKRSVTTYLTIEPLFN